MVAHLCCKERTGIHQAAIFEADDYELLLEKVAAYCRAIKTTYSNRIYTFSWSLNYTNKYRALNIL